MSDLRAFYDRKYDHLQLQGGETGQRTRKRRALLLMEKHSLLTPGKWAIEFGCGTGEILLILREHGLEVCGVELSASAARQAQDEGLKVHEFDLSSKKAPWDGKFDFCFSLEVMEHVYDPWRFTFNMNSVLKMGGHALISVPNFHSWRMQLLYLLARRSPIETDNIHHIRFYSANFVRRLFQRQGFKVLEITSGIPLEDHGFLPRLLGWLPFLDGFGAKLFVVAQKKRIASVESIMDLALSEWHF